MVVFLIFLDNVERERERERRRKGDPEVFNLFKKFLENPQMRKETVTSSTPVPWQFGCSLLSKTFSSEIVEQRLFDVTLGQRQVVPSIIIEESNERVIFPFGVPQGGPKVTGPGWPSERIIVDLRPDR